MDDSTESTPAGRLAVTLGGGALALIGLRMCLEGAAELVPRVALGVGLVLSAGGTVMAVLGARGLPRRPLRRTRATLREDAREFAQEARR